MTTTPLIPGTYNSRDLGGIPVADGMIRPGAIVRSDAPVELGDAGRAAIGALKIRTAIDLREDKERELDPADLDGLGLVREYQWIIGGGLERHRHLGIDEIYRDLIEARADRLTAAVRLLARPGTLPALVFCSAGKDRTGLVSALTLGAAGASDEAIAADYGITALNMAEGPFRAKVTARAIAAGFNEQEMLTKVGSPPELMLETLAFLREHHDGPREFLLAAGMPERELDALRDALVVPAVAQAA